MMVLSQSLVMKKIFEGKTGEDIHNEFVKFSRGSFGDRYLVEAKKGKGIWRIKTTAEYANYFVRKCLEKFSGKVKVKGVIVATFDVSSEVGFEIERVKQFMGIKQVVINNEVEP